LCGFWSRLQCGNVPGPRRLVISSSFLIHRLFVFLLLLFFGLFKVFSRLVSVD
jgi:hypothetical protein